jgi:hypothetical protein
MSGRFFLSTALAALLLGSLAVDAAQGAVSGPSSVTSQAVQSLDVTHHVRRVCRTRLACERFPCRFVQQCYVTKDYPPEHGRR